MFGRVVSPALLQAVMWTESTETDVASFLQDASDLATMFAMPIMESTPHIYVTMIPFSKDESMVSAHYSMQMSSMVQVETIGTKRPLKYMRVLEGHKEAVWSVAISPDGRLIASASSDHTIKVWDFHSGEEIMTLADKSYKVSFFPDGKRLASASWKRGLRIWDVQTGEVILGPLQGQGRIHTVAISPDGRKIASGRSDRTIVLCDTSNGMELKRFVGHTYAIWSIAFSPDGTLLASGSSDSTRIWEIDSGEPTFRTLASIGDCYLVSFTPDGKYLVSSYGIHEVESGNVAFVFGGFIALSCFPCGTRAFVDCRVGGNDFSVLDLTNGKVVSDLFEGHTVRSVAITPDGRHVICGSGSDDKTVRIWDAAAANGESKTFEAHKIIYDVTISDDGSRIASYSGKSIIIWDAQTGDVISGPLNPGYATNKCIMAFSSDNSRLISGSGEIRVWDVATGQLAFSPIERWSNCMAISPDNTMIASGHHDGTLKVWGMATGQLIVGPPDVFTHDVTSLEFSPNRNRLASGSENGNIRVWNITTWEVISEVSAGSTDRINSIRFSPDSTQLAFESVCGLDITVTVLDVEQGHIVTDSFKLPGVGLSSLVFTLDGLYRVAVAAGNDSYISVRKLLDADGVHSKCDPLVLRCPEKFAYNNYLLASSRDGLRIVSCLDLKTINVWDVSDFLSKRCKDGSNALPNWKLGHDGWIVAEIDNEKRDLLMWVPHDLRRTLCQEGITAVLNCKSKFFTKLDFLDAALGDRWSECFPPSYRKALG
ncbi:hypothetical protein ACEPAF_2059 [Sanghuangporus sanghuang]